MLQQTQVATVIPYYDRFLARWPTVGALAAADPESIRAAWSGLGYYRRAKLMQDAAQAIVRDHDGQLPREVDALRALPGFGRYTAGAVASIAFDAPAPAVDGNVQRVLARIHGIEGDVTKGPGGDRVWAEAEDLTRRSGSPSELNQSLMELGATVCAPRAPRCLLCPVSAECAAREAGTIEQIPPPKKRPKRTLLSLTAIAVFADRKTVVLEQRPPEGLLAGLWCLPLLDGHPDPKEVPALAKDRWGWRLRNVKAAGELTHVMTHRDLVLRLVRAEAFAAAPEGLAEVERSALGRLGIPRVTARALELLEAPPHKAVARPGRRVR
jgi:A/G-specific adenine glycosylase